MKIHPQIINKGNKAEFVVLPIDEYNRLLSFVVDRHEVEEVKERLENPQETFPLEIVELLSNGEHPVKVFREYRGLSQSLLAKKINVSKQYISQIENFDRKGTVKVLKAIAKVLKAELNELVKVVL